MDSSYFYSLVNPRNLRKHRNCLRCHHSFISQHYGHRICGACRAIVDHQGVRAGSLPTLGDLRDVTA